MDNVIYECENITPIIMNGANSKYKCLELRSQSIKGWMRYWWRAITAYDDLKKLKDKEKEIFGSLDKKADFSIRVSYKKNNFIPEIQNIVPHRELEEYDGTKKSIKINVIKNVKFNLKLSFHNDKYKELICCLFEICCVLGGIGKRSRRGFGSIRIVKKNDEKYEFIYSLEEILNRLNLITKISKNEYLYRKGKMEIYIIRRINTKYPFVERIMLGNINNVNSADKLIQKIGIVSHNHCNNKLINKYDKSLLEVLGEKDDGKINRYASPLYVSIIKINEKIQPIVTVLHSNEIKMKDILVKERQVFIDELYNF